MREIWFLVVGAILLSAGWFYAQFTGGFDIITIGKVTGPLIAVIMAVVGGVILMGIYLQKRYRVS